jgi:hypothetical protein
MRMRHMARNNSNRSQPSERGQLCPRDPNSTGSRTRLSARLLLLLICGIGLNAAAADNPAKGAMLTIQRAQLAMNDIPAFKGNVKTIRTDVLVDRVAEDLYPTREKSRDQWNLTGGDHP